MIVFNSTLEKRYANIERVPWLDVIDNDSNMGLFLWVGINYLGESRNWPRVGSASGLFDEAGFPTCRAFLYEAFWSEKPMVNIQVYRKSADNISEINQWVWPLMDQNWNLEKGAKKDLVTYTNCEAVDLYLNNKKIGRKTLADFPNWIMKWKEIEYEPGTLKAVGIIGGKEVCSTVLNTTSAPLKFDIEVDRVTLRPNEVANIEVYLVDKAGNSVVAEDKELQFSIEGGEIIGLANGHIDHQFKADNHSSLITKKGKGLCVVRASNSSEVLSLKISASGMIEKKIAVRINRHFQK